VRTNLVDSKQLTDEGVRARMRDVVKPHLANILAKRQHNTNRAKALLERNKSTAQVPAIEPAEVQLFVDNWRHSTAGARERLMSGAIGGNDPKLAAAMHAYPQLFGITDSTRELLAQRFSAAAPQLSPTDEAVLQCATALEAELADLQTEIETSVADATPETPLQAAQRIAKAHAQGDAA